MENKSKSAICINAYNKNILKRFLLFLRIILILIYSKSNKIFIHQGTILVIFPIWLFKYNLIRKIVFKIFHNLSNHNDLTVEVNDLPYEQSIDLELDVNENYKIFEYNLYKLENVSFIFASVGMKNYASKIFQMNTDKVSTLINGSPMLQVPFDKSLFGSWTSSDKIKCVYAGSLNQGRQIEEMISGFESLSNCLLILIGNEGEWIFSQKLANNIKYLGAFDEKTAHQITASCDIGLIPYDSTRLYYNIAFPTKVSFYICAGIPVLSTKVLELTNHFENKNYLHFQEMKYWKLYLQDLKIDFLQELKLQLEVDKDSYLWTNLISNFYQK